MKKNIILWLAASAVVMLAFPWLAVTCNAALYSRQKKHFIFDTIDILTALSFR